MNTRDPKRQRQHVPLPASMPADEAVPSNASVQRPAHLNLPQQEALQPLVEYVVQELLTRLLADLPGQCVIHVSLNARGNAQFELRRGYPSLEVAKEYVQRDITDMVNAIRAGLRGSRVTLASDEK